MKVILRSIRRAPYQNLSLSLSLISALFILTMSMFGIGMLYGLLNYAETRPQLTVYFRPGVEKSLISEMKEKLVSSGKVLKVKYISQEEALKIYKKLNKNNKLLLEMISPDIFPASLEIYAKHPQYLFEIAAFAKKQKGVDDVIFEKNIVNKLIKLTSVVKKLTLYFSLYFLLVALIILSTLTMFKIILKKEEIELLRLLGASKWLIIKPFLLENILLSFFSSILSFLLFVGLYKYFEPVISNYLQGISSLEINSGFIKMEIWPNILEFLVLIFIVNIIFGFFIVGTSTIIASYKYLHER